MLKERFTGPIAIATCLTAVALLSACDTTEPCEPRDGVVVTEDNTIGTGLAVSSVNDSVFVYYVGTLENLSLFDSHVPQNADEPIGFIVGQLIEGWKQGLIGMREGGRRKVTVPPSLGYGCRELRNIPPNSSLIFDITLERVVIN